MEYDIIFSDKVNQTGFGIFPPGFPWIGKQFFCIGYVTDWCIEPYVENFTFGTLYRNRNPPVEVTADCTRLQTHIEPAFALSVHVRTPFFVFFQYPLAQPCFMFVKWQIPVFGFFHDRFAAADGTFRINQVSGRQWSSALFALVTIGTFRMTVRTFTGDVAVGQKLVCFFIIILFRSFFDKLSFFV